MQRCIQLTDTNSPCGLFFFKPLSFPVNYTFEYFLGVHREEGIPDPIPNSAVKLFIAHDTAYSCVGK